VLVQTFEKRGKIILGMINNLAGKNWREKFDRKILAGKIWREKFGGKFFVGELFVGKLFVEK
jgi:hypothetical protein